MGEPLWNAIFGEMALWQLFTPQLSTTYPPKNDLFEKESASPEVQLA
jgi:hypothetical protein